MATEERQRSAPEGDGKAEEFEFHTGVIRETGVPDAIEFVDVYKSFGKNHVLRGLNMGLPEARSR